MPLDDQGASQPAALDFSGLKPYQPPPEGGGQQPKLDFSKLTPLAGQPEPQPQSVGILAAPFYGAKRALQETAQATEARPTPLPEETISEAQPFNLADIPHPIQALGKALYQLGHSTPSLGLGVAAGAAGTAGATAAGLPPPLAGAVGLATGAVGAAGGAMVQSIGPTFAGELQKTPNDAEGAWTRSLEKAALEGGASGVAWAVFPYAPSTFKTAIKESLFKALVTKPGVLEHLASQAFVAQPAIAAGQQALSNVIEGQPTGQGVAQAAEQAVPGTLVPLVGTHAARWVGHRLVGARTPEEQAAQGQQQPGEQPPTAAAAMLPPIGSTVTLGGYPDGTRTPTVIAHPQPDTATLQHADGSTEHISATDLATRQGAATPAQPGQPTAAQPAPPARPAEEAAPPVRQPAPLTVEAEAAATAAAPTTTPEPRPAPRVGPEDLAAQEQRDKLAALAGIAKPEPAVPRPEPLPEDRVDQLYVAPEQRPTTPTPVSEAAAEARDREAAAALGAMAAAPQVAPVPPVPPPAPIIQPAAAPAASPPPIPRTPGTVRLDGQWFRDQIANANGDMGAASDRLAEIVSNALSEGRLVTLYTDGKPTPITAVDRGMMQDEQGNRWGTMVVATDNTGRNFVDIGQPAPPEAPAPILQPQAEEPLPPPSEQPTLPPEAPGGLPEGLPGPTLPGHERPSSEAAAPAPEERPAPEVPGGREPEGIRTEAGAAAPAPEPRPPGEEGDRRAGEGAVPGVPPGGREPTAGVPGTAVRPPEPPGEPRPPVERTPDADVKGQNYQIAPGALAEDRSFRVKAVDNVEAIRLAKQLVAEGRPATKEEQAILAKYVGWGGLSGAFPDPSTGAFRQGFEDVGNHLKELLTPEEYRTAARSTQYAHYTSETVIRNMWAAVQHMGFKGGAVFEPGMGIGHFLGMMPGDLAEKSRYQGLELDGITAQIAKLLYPESGVRQADYTRTPIPADTFDLVIGNPPFGDIAIKADPKYAAKNFLLHDYFFAKSLDSTRPGGLLAFVTSAGTMNKLDPAARQYLAQRAEFVGGVRLPNDAFRRNAGTEVTTDILFFRKHQFGPIGLGENPPPWTETVARDLPNRKGEIGQGNVSRYFSEHPEQVLGEEGFFDRLVAAERYGVRPRPGVDLGTELNAALSRLPADVMLPEPTPEQKAALDFSTTERKDGSFYVGPDGRLMQYSGGAGRPVQRFGAGVKGGFTPAEMQTIRGLLPIRDALRDVYRGDLASDDVLAADARARLNLAYDEFTARHGPINKADITYRRPSIVQQETARNIAREEAREAGNFFDEGDFDPTPMLERKAKANAIAQARAAARLQAEKEGREFNHGSFDPDAMPDIVVKKLPNIDPFSDDQESYRLRAIEDYNDETGAFAKRKIFTENILSRPQEPELRSANDGILWSINKFGRLDLDQIAAKLGIPREQAIADMGDNILRVPGTEATYQPRDAYLSGDVVSKLEEARTAADQDPSFQKNVVALEAAQPRPLTPSEVSITLGMPWIPSQIVRDFVNEMEMGRAKIEYSPIMGKWLVDARNAVRGPRHSEWSTPDVPAHVLLADTLNRKSAKVLATDPGPPKRTVVDPVATQAAQDKMDAIKQAFTDWALRDPERTDKLVGLYNNQYNRVVLRQWNGDYLTTPGVSSDWHWRPHQTRVVARIIQDGNTYMAHAVGAGKTSAMIGAGMEMRRLGLISKPMYVVPNHMLGQFAKEFYEQYPTARIRVADDRNFHTDRRKQFIADVAQQDLDAIIITNSAFGRLPISQEFGERLINEEIDNIDEALKQLGQNPNELKKINEEAWDNRITVKQLQKYKERMQQKLLGIGGTQDEVNTFEELGADFLFVDEAHCFPHEAKVMTDHGLLPIGEIVERQLPVRVASYDHSTKRVMWRSIHNYWRYDRAEQAIFSVKTTRGELYCTGNHQVFIAGRGYVRADQIRPGENLFSLRDEIHTETSWRRRSRAAVLLTQMPRRCARLVRRKTLSAMRRQLFVSQQRADKQCETKILQHFVSGSICNVRTGPSISYYGGDARGYAGQAEVRSGTRGERQADARTQPDAPTRGTQKDASEIGRANFSCTRREWQSDETATRYPRIDWSPDGVCDPNEESAGTIREFAKSLQGRFGRSQADACYRNRRPHPYAKALAFSRRSQDRSVVRARVVSIEILERGSERERRCCGGEDRYVYDLGIEGEHNYFVNGLLVHNSFRKLSFVTQAPKKGIDPKGSNMAWDLYTKIRYLDENRPGRSVVMASGTPVTNTMGELYTLSRYMQPEALKERGLSHFDSWAQTFGDTTTAIEQTAQGTYEPVTRFSKFINMPELYKMVGSVMDVVTPTELGQYVHRPDIAGGARDYHVAPRTDFLEAMQEQLAQRVAAIKQRKGPPSKGDDILLSVINDGRLMAIDPRFVDPSLPSDPDSKLNQMIGNVHRIWEETKNQPFYEPGTDQEVFRGPATQIMFSNLGIQGGAGRFSGYQWMKREWARMGIPASEVAFIKDYDNKPIAEKQRLFNDVNEGKVRILVGSTAKMGTGVNVQRRLAAIHNLDPLWYPADDEQRNGRGIRQGNLNKEIQIHDYSTKGTYDSTMWGMMGRKGRFIEQFFRGDPNLREMEDLGEASTYEQASAIATADERVIQLTEMRQDLEKLERRKMAHESEQYTARYKAREARDWVGLHQEKIEGYDQAMAAYAQHGDISGQNFRMMVGNAETHDRADAAKALDALIPNIFARLQPDERVEVGSLGGFPIFMKDVGKRVKTDAGWVTRKADRPIFEIQFWDQERHDLGGQTGPGIIQSASAFIRQMPQRQQLFMDRQRGEAARAESYERIIGRPFEGGEQIQPLRQQIARLEAALSGAGVPEDQLRLPGSQLTTLRPEGEFVGATPNWQWRGPQLAEERWRGRPVEEAPRVPIADSLVDELRAHQASGALNPQEATRNWVMTHGAYSGNEHFGILHGGTGEILEAGTSHQPDVINFHDEAVRRFIDPNGVPVDIHHNHPGGNSLSTPDLTVLPLRNIRWAVAHTADGAISAARLTPQAREWFSSMSPADGQQQMMRLSRTANAPINKTLQQRTKFRLLAPGRGVQLDRELTNRALAAAGMIDHVSTRAVPGWTRNLVERAAQSISKELPWKPPPDAIRDAYRSARPVLSLDEAMGRLSRPDEGAAGPGERPGAGGYPGGAGRAEEPGGPRQAQYLAEETRESRLGDLQDRVRARLAAPLDTLTEAPPREAVEMELGPPGPPQPPSAAQRAMRFFGVARGQPGQRWFNPVNFYTTFPQTAARYDFGGVSRQKWQAENARDERQRTLQNSYLQNFGRIRGLTAPENRLLSAALELERLQNKETPLDGRAVILHNASTADPNDPLAHQPLAQNSRPGDWIRLDTPRLIDAYAEYRRGMEAMYKDYVAAIARRYGWEGNPDYHDIMAAAEAETDTDRKNDLVRTARLVGAAQFAERTAYTPFMRQGDYFFRVLPKEGAPGYDPNRERQTTTWYSRVDSQLPEEKLLGGRRERSATVDAARTALRQSFPEEHFDLEEGYYHPQADVLRDLMHGVPAIEELFQIAGRNLSREWRDRIRRAPAADRDALREQMAEAQKIHQRTVDALLDKVYEEMKAGFRRRAMNIPGYDPDAMRSTGRYIGWMAGHIADLEHRDAIEQADFNVDRSYDPRTRQFWHDWDAYQDRVTQPSSLNWGVNKLKTGAFLWALGGNAASTLKFFLHGPMLGFPTLSTGFGPTGRMDVGRIYLSALKDGVASIRATGREGFDARLANMAKNDNERRLIEQEELSGRLHGRIAEELGALDRQQGIESLSPQQSFNRRVVRLWSSNIAAADRATRGAMLLAAYRAASRPGAMDTINRVWGRDALWGSLPEEQRTPAEFARFMVDRTTGGAWGPQNRLPLARSAIGGLLFQFRQYESLWLSNLYNNLVHMGPEGKASGLMMLAGLGALAGATGLPFAEDAEKAYEWVHERITGVDPDIEKKIEDFFHADPLGLGPNAGRSILYGLQPFGMDLGGLSFGHMLSQQIQSPFEVAGAAVNIFGGAPSRMWERHQSGQSMTAQVAELLPTALKNMVRAFGVYPDEGVKTATGRMVIAPEAVTGREQAIRAIGMTPAEEADIARQRAHEARAASNPWHQLDTLALREANLRARGLADEARAARAEAMQVIVQGMRSGVFAPSTTSQPPYAVTEFNRKVIQLLQQQRAPEAGTRVQQRMRAASEQGARQPQP